MSYVSNSIWHIKLDGNKITGKVTQLEDLAIKKDIEIVDLKDLIHLKRHHFFTLYKFILNKKFNVSNLDNYGIFNHLLEKAFIDVDTKYPIYIFKELGIYRVVLDGNRRLDKAYLLGEKNIKAKIFYKNELIKIIEKHGLNN